MPAIEVRPVSSLKELRTFLTLPWRIYRNYPNWVPPLIVDTKGLLDTRKNPFYQHAEICNFVAYRDGEPAGRISAIVDRNYVEFQDDRAGLFGFFETVEDGEVSQALFSAAEAWIQERGMERLLGPANPSTNHIFGLLVEGFDKPPMVMMPYSPPYYDGLIKACGLKKAKDLYAYHMDDSIPISDRIRRVSEIIKKRHNVTVRSAVKKQFQHELELIKTVYNDAWTKNWAFVPWTDEEFEHMGKDIKMIVNFDFILLAFVDGEIAGASIALPNINQALKYVKNGRLFPFGLFKLLWAMGKVSEIRCAVMGVRHKYRGMGLDAVFYHDTYELCVNNNYSRNVEISWILEDNMPMRNALERWGSIRYKTYRVYEKEFVPSKVDGS